MLDISDIINGGHVDAGICVCIEALNVDNCVKAVVALNNFQTTILQRIKRERGKWTGLRASLVL